MNSKNQNLSRILNKIFRDKNVAIVAVVILVLSLILPVYVGFFNYANGDDLLYGSILRNGFRHNVPISELAAAVWKDVVDEYCNFQGTWASQILWRLEPSIWGERVYIITIFMSLGILITGIAYMTKTVISKLLGYNKWIWLTMSSLILFFCIQFMPYPRGGLYWYTGMVQYTFAYGVSMFSIGWSIRYVLSGKKRYLIGDIITLAYLGGAGFPAIVQCGMIIFFIFIWQLFRADKVYKKRGCMLLIPLLFLAIGFGISALAPGNSIRGGEDYGFSWLRVVNVFIDSFKDGISYGIDYVKTIRPLLLVPLLSFVLGTSISKDEHADMPNSLLPGKATIKEMIVVIILGFTVVCMVHSPEKYAGNTVTAGFSGGVFDIYFYVFVMWVAFSGFVVGNAVRDKLEDKHLMIKNVVCIFTILFVVILWRFLIGNSLDYLCYNYVSSGALKDFDAQMKERLEILEDDSIKDVVLPEMNDEQGPLMHMPLTDDPQQYTNYVTGLFYEKNSIVAITRDEWNENYK